MKKSRRPAMRLSKSHLARQRTNATTHAPSRKRPRSIQAQLEKAAAGLTFPSEADLPFGFFTIPGQGMRHLNAEGFLSLLGLNDMFLRNIGLPAQAFIKERPLKGFLPSIRQLAASHGTTTTDSTVIAKANRYRKLEALLKRHLKGPKVFRVGDVGVACYIAGLHKGNAVGLMTISVET